MHFCLCLPDFMTQNYSRIFYIQEVHAQLPIQSKVCSIIRCRHEFRTFHSLCPLLNFDKAYKAWQMLEKTCLKKFKIYHLYQATFIVCYISMCFLFCFRLMLFWWWYNSNYNLFNSIICYTPFIEITSFRIQSHPSSMVEVYNIMTL